MKEEIKEGYKKTEIGVIPEEWRIEKIGELTEIKTGGTPSKKIVEYWEGGDVPWMLSGDINKEIVREVSGAITKLGIENSAAKILPKKTIMIALNGQGKTKGKVAYLEIKTSCNQSLAGILPNPKNFYSKYLYYHLQNRYEEIRGLAGDGARNGLNLGLIKEIKIILPNILEQQKIASILSTVDEYIEQTDKLIEKTKELKKGLMQKLLTKGIGHTELKKTEIGEIPKEWEVMPLFDTGEYINGRAFKPCEWVDKGTPIIRIQNLNDKNAPYNYYNLEVDKKYHVYKGDLLFAWSGSIGLHIWKGYKAYLNQHIYKVVPNKNVDKRYLYYKLSRQIEILLELSHGSTMKHITRKNLRLIKIPLPPLNEQQKIASILSEVDNQIEQYELKKEKLQIFKKGLMQKLLTGKIRVKVYN